MMLPENTLLEICLTLADILPAPPPEPQIPGTDSNLPSSAFVAIAGALISGGVLMATAIAFRTRKPTAARIGFGIFAAAILATILAVSYTSAQHAAQAEAIREIRNNYEGPAPQPEDWPLPPNDDQPATSEEPIEGMGEDVSQPD